MQFCIVVDWSGGVLLFHCSLSDVFWSSQAVIVGSFAVRSLDDLAHRIFLFIYNAIDRILFIIFQIHLHCRDGVLVGKFNESALFQY